MKYWLYQGCSLEASGSPYMVPLESVGRALDMEFEEIPDWNCCSASIGYVGGNETQVYALNARNLALAEAGGSRDIVAPCSSCYILMNKVNRGIQEDEQLAAQMNQVLAEADLSYGGSLNVRHLLDVLYKDVGLDKIKAAVKKPLTGLKVGGYVGCQTVRPFGEYDSVEKPVVLDEIIRALGAEPVEFPKRIRCCGSGIFLTEMDHCSELAKDIIEDAAAHGATLLTTACPMCQLNLEAYQGEINKRFNTNIDMPVTFINQLMAVAFGLDWKSDAALDRNIVKPDAALAGCL